MKNLTTRIIAGKYKGKTIDLPALDVTRSSKAILKESFFNVLQFDIVDCVFVEGFGGSGSIGLEALSRGAYSSYFVEINKGSFRTLCKNCDFIDASNTTTLFGDTFEILPKLVNTSINATNKRVVLYLDPPFDFRDGMSAIYEKTYDLVKSIDNENVFLITFEHKSELMLPDTIGNYTKFKSKKFGNSTLSYYN